MFVYLAILLNATYKSSFCNVVAKRAFRTKVLVRRMRRIYFYVLIIFLSSAKIIKMRSPTLQPNLVLPSFRRREKKLIRVCCSSVRWCDGRCTDGQVTEISSIRFCPTANLLAKLDHFYEIINISLLKRNAPAFCPTTWGHPPLLTKERNEPPVLPDI